MNKSSILPGWCFPQILYKFYSGRRYLYQKRTRILNELEFFFFNRLCGNFFVKSYNCVCFGKNKVIKIFLFIEYCIIREDREERDSPEVIFLQFR